MKGFITTWLNTVRITTDNNSSTTIDFFVMHDRIFMLWCKSWQQVTEIIDGRFIT